MKPNLIMYCFLEICLLVTEAVLIFNLEVGSLLYSFRKYSHSLIFSYVNEPQFCFSLCRQEAPCFSLATSRMHKSILIKAVDF